MARTNKKVVTEKVYTHGGAIAARTNAEGQLSRSVMATMLWEDQFYENGRTIAKRIADGVKNVSPEFARAVAIEAREQMKLRHAPLLVAREMARLPEHRKLVASTLETIIQRPDELAEYVALYWQDGRKPLSAQSKKGLARAFGKFNAYQLAKYNQQDRAVKLRDVLFLCHAKPANTQQAEVYKQLVDGTLPAPDTWEVSLSAARGSDEKRVVWERLLKENKLGALALLRNLRNMEQVGVPRDLVREAIKNCNTDRVLPFRFITAARYAPHFQSELEDLMLRSVQELPCLSGHTILVVDVSGSMSSSLSGKSELSRYEAAAALAALAREQCKSVSVYATAGNDGRGVHATKLIKPYHGFAMIDAIKAAPRVLGSGGIFLTQCMDYIERDQDNQPVDRVIVFTDEQDCDRKLNPSKAVSLGVHNYIVNVASATNGVKYGQWHHIDGFSERVLDYIQMVER